MKILKLFAIQANSDTNAGGGYQKDIYYATSLEEASKIVNNPLFYQEYGVQGCPPYENGKYDVVEKEIIILESAEELVDAENRKRISRVNSSIQSVFSKLSKKEKELLKGFYFDINDGSFKKAN